MKHPCLSRSLLLAIALAGGVLLTVPSATPGAAEPVLLEGIVAQVGDQIILESELQEQLAIARMRYSLPDSAVTQAREEILARLIDERIIIQEAQAQGLTVTEEEIAMAIERTVDQLRQQVGSEEAFQRALQEEGITLEELRALYRDQAQREILYSRLVQREIYSKIEVTAEEVEIYYREHREDLPEKKGTVTLSHVYLGIRPSEEALAEAQAKIDQVRERLDEGEDFSTIAADLSDDPGSRDTGGDIGWFGRGTLDPIFEQVAFGLEPGETSEPFQTGVGVEVVKLLERDEERVHAAHILVILRSTPADRDRTLATARKVHDLALAGTSFGALADTYSDDRDSAAKGGDLGDFATDDLVPFVAQAIDGLRVGDISDVVEADQGFHVFKLTKREEGGEFALDEVQGQLRNMIMEERAAEMTEDYVKEIRGNYYVRRTDGREVALSGGGS